MQQRTHIRYINQSVFPIEMASTTPAALSPSTFLSPAHAYTHAYMHDVRPRAKPMRPLSASSLVVSGAAPSVGAISLNAIYEATSVNASRSGPELHPNIKSKTRPTSLYTPRSRSDGSSPPSFDSLVQKQSRYPTTSPASRPSSSLSSGSRVPHPNSPSSPLSQSLPRPTSPSNRFSRTSFFLDVVDESEGPGPSNGSSNGTADYRRLSRGSRSSRTFRPSPLAGPAIVVTAAENGEKGSDWNEERDGGTGDGVGGRGQETRRDHARMEAFSRLFSTPRASPRPPSSPASLSGHASTTLPLPLALSTRPQLPPPPVAPFSLSPPPTHSGFTRKLSLKRIRSAPNLNFFFSRIGTSGSKVKNKNTEVERPERGIRVRNDPTANATVDSTLR